MQVVETSHADMIANKPCRNEPLPPAIEADISVVDDILQRFRGRVRKAAKRRAVPDGTAPVEVWLMLLWPNFRFSLDNLGVGHQDFRFYTVEELRGAKTCRPIESRGLRAPCFFQAIKRFLIFLRRARAVPVRWNFSFAAQLDKCNGKSGPDGLRLVFVFEAFGKDFFACTILPDKEPDNFVYGYAVGKSREGAISTQLVCSHRLKKLGVSFAVSYHDVVNAFCSVDLNCLQAAALSVTESWAFFWIVERVTDV